MWNDTRGQTWPLIVMTFQGPWGHDCLWADIFPKITRNRVPISKGDGPPDPQPAWSDYSRFSYLVADGRTEKAAAPGSFGFKSATTE